MKTIWSETKCPFKVTISAVAIVCVCVFRSGQWSSYEVTCTCVVYDSTAFPKCQSIRFPDALFPLTFFSKDQSANGVKAPSSSAASTRWATAPWWVVVIRAVGPKWAGRRRGLHSLSASVELLLLSEEEEKVGKRGRWTRSHDKVTNVSQTSH